MGSRQKVVVIGAGFAGLSAACHLAHQGVNVTVVEKHDIPGGRARYFDHDGFRFDMGPSWYWMPDVFERFFGHFGKQVKAYYQLQLLSPAFSVVFGQDDVLEIPADPEKLYEIFEAIEPGSAVRLKKFFAEAAYKYAVGMQDLVYKPGLAWSEFADMRLVKGLFQLGVFQSYASHVRRYFKDPRLIRLMEFPVLFLGGMPRQIPALYSLMAYAGLTLGTWYPMGGMYEIIRGMHRLAEDLGVRFAFGREVTGIEIEHGRVQGVRTSGEHFRADAVISSADYHHTEQALLEPQYRSYREKYWDSRVLAPSAVIFYVGLNRKLPRLNHHTLFFDAPFDDHASAIYRDPALPERPLFYVCAPSVTDPGIAPADCENLFILVPLSTRMTDSEELREACYQKVIRRLNDYTGLHLQDHVIYTRSYAMDDFKNDYHALRGNAYGLANTLMQTANLKPRMRSKKVSNLFFAGQLTVPGPGVPPALVSGEIAATLAIDTLKYNKNHMPDAATSV